MRRMLIKELGKVITGNTPSMKNTEFYNSNDIGFVKPDIFENSRITHINSTNSFISEKARNKARIVKKDTVLITCIGSIGKVGIIEGAEYSFNQQINAIEPNDKVVAKYLAYNILSNKNRLMDIANAPVVPIINKTQFENFDIVINENIEEQKRIVKILDQTNRIITLRRNQLNELDRLIKSRFVEMFGDGSYEIKSLSELTDTITKGTTPTTAGYHFVDKGINFFKIESINVDHTINLDKVAYVGEACHDAFKRSQLREGDILFSIAGVIGRTAIINLSDLPGNINQALAIIRLQKDCGLQQRFLITALESPMVVEQYDKKKRGIAQINLSLQDINSLKVVIPPINLQNEFTDFCKQVEKLKFCVQQSLNETQELFDSLMQEYFG